MKKIAITTASTIEFLKMEDITHVEARRSGTTVHTTRIALDSTKPLQYYKQVLQDPYFVPCHKSYLVNLNYVLRYHKRGELELTSGLMVPVSRRRRDQVLEDMLGNWD